MEEVDGQDQRLRERHRQRARSVRLLSLLQIAFGVIGSRFVADMKFVRSIMMIISVSLHIGICCVMAIGLRAVSPAML